MTTVLFFFLVLVFSETNYVILFVLFFFCMHTFVCMGGVAHVCGCLWRPEVDMDVVLDFIPLLSTETGCLAEPRAHQLGSLPSHLSLDPCSYLLSAGIAGRAVMLAWLLCGCWQVFYPLGITPAPSLWYSNRFSVSPIPFTLLYGMLLEGRVVPYSSLIISIGMSPWISI